MHVVKVYNDTEGIIVQVKKDGGAGFLRFLRESFANTFIHLLSICTPLDFKWENSKLVVEARINDALAKMVEEFDKPGRSALLDTGSDKTALDKVAWDAGLTIIYMYEVLRESRGGKHQFRGLRIEAHKVGYYRTVYSNKAKLILELLKRHGVVVWAGFGLTLKAYVDSKLLETVIKLGELRIRITRNILKELMDAVDDLDRFCDVLTPYLLADEIKGG